MRKTKFLFAIIVCHLIFTSHHSFAIGDDSTYHRYNPNWTHYFFAKDFSKRYVVDTSLNRFEIYDAGKSRLGLSNLGNLGLPYYSSVFCFRKDILYDIGFHSFDNYLFKPDNIRFYDTKKPYSHLFYVFGPKNEQQLTGTHTQNISNLINAGFEFRLSGSDGIYQWQRADILNIDIFGSYHSRNERYHLSPYIIFNKLKWNNNGGVTNDSVFTDPLLLSKDLASIALDSSRTIFRGKDIGFTHSYDWGTAYDQRINDTVTIKKFHASARLEHRFHFADYKYIYHDDTTDFAYYHNRFNYSRTKTNDSLLWKMIENNLSFQLLPEKERINDTTVTYRKLSAAFSINHRLYLIQNLGEQTNMQQITGSFVLQNAYQKKWIYGLSVEGGLQSENHITYHAGLHAGYRISENLGVAEVTLSSRSVLPSFLQQQYYSNHYSWRNYFSSYSEHKAGMEWKSDRLNFLLRAEYLQLSNYIFWNTLAVPEQSLNNITGVVVTLQKNFTLGKFHLNNELAIQQFSDASVISVPEYVGFHSLYFQNNLFKNALRLSAGVNVYYTSGYYFPAFSPATSQFYLQKEMKANFYPVTDVFVNMGIRSARIFIKMENLSQGWWLPGYYTALDYPAADKAVKIGISWMFWN